MQGKSNGTAGNSQTCPLNKDYSCDACQRDFTSKETLNAHLGSHVQVCHFVKVISHVQCNMMHITLKVN